MSGYVYLVEAVGTGLFKIGMASNVRNRIKSLQTACPYRLRLVNCCHCPEPMLLENELHRLFDEHRKVGEWFALPYAAVKECVTLLAVSNEPAPEPIATETVKALEAAFDLADIPEPETRCDDILMLQDRDAQNPANRATRVREMRQQGLTQTQIIKIEWGVSPGKSSRYEAAVAEYKAIIEEQA